MKCVLSTSAAIAVGTALLFGNPSSAIAAGCIYSVGQVGVGSIGISAHGYAAKKKKACKRARAKCNRRLERARKKSQLPRGGSRDFHCREVASQ